MLNLPPCFLSTKPAINGYGTEGSLTERAAFEVVIDFCSGDRNIFAGDWRSGMVVGAFVCTRIGKPEAFGLSINY